MIEQLANDITFYAFFVSSKTGKTGLTVTIDVYEAVNGTPIVSAGSATALAGGLYYYTLAGASVDNVGAYVAIFKTTDTTVDQQHIPALWVIGTAGVENLDAAVSTRLAPTVASRTLDVTASGGAGIDWSNVENATSIVLLTNTQISQQQQILGVTGGVVLTTAGRDAMADAVWDEAISGHTTTGSTGAALSAASAAGDPWGTSLPGAYGSGSAGAILGGLTGVSVTVVNPVAADGDATIRQGKDYSPTIGTALQWTLSSPPGTTPTSVTFTCRALGFSKACSYSSPTITLTLTAAETAAFAAGAYKFEIEAVISTLNTALVAGTITVERDV